MLDKLCIVMALQQMTTRTLHLAASDADASTIFKEMSDDQPRHLIVTGSAYLLANEPSWAPILPSSTIIAKDLEDVFLKEEA